MKREKQNTYNRKTAREMGGAPMGGGRWVLVTGAPLTEKINEAGALMGGGRSGLGGRSSVDRKGKAVRSGAEPP
jgi:hypothetical protein